MNTDRYTSYNIIRPIGVEDAGAYGNVYLAEQILLATGPDGDRITRSVAIKEMKSALKNDPQFIRRFSREIELLVELSHPHIVALVDAWRDLDTGLFYLVMPFLEGESMARQLQRFDAFTIDKCARFLDQVAPALDYVHSKRVVHRDIKPANILYDLAGNAYLADFGIASHLHSDSQRGSSPGTPAYDAPEILNGETPTAATDIYSMGITLFQMLTGKLPFKLTRSDAEDFHLNRPLPSLKRYNPDLPSSLNDVLQTAIHKDPSQRYRTALLLRDAFRTAMGVVTSEQAVLSTALTTAIPVAATPENPYVGLRAFSEADAEHFYGRTATVETLLEKMSGTLPEDRFMALVGPGGSGKSSVIKAGLIPALRGGALAGSEHWYYAEMKPGQKPFQELLVALKKTASAPERVSLRGLREENGVAITVKQMLPDDEHVDLLLYIDQFEELFAVTTSEEDRSSFIAHLLDAIDDHRSRLRVVISLRADYYDRPLQYFDFGDLLRKRMVTILPLSDRELRDAIEKPASAVGVKFDAGLVDRIVEDVREQPGNLPLLQFALTDLFERSEGLNLTHGIYDDIGRVTGSLALNADKLYDGATEAGKNAIRQLFLRLVVPGDGERATRRRVRRSELDGIADEMGNILTLFSSKRLLTLDRDELTREPTVEVAHEALIHTWPDLREWIDLERDSIRIQQQLAPLVQTWQDNDYDSAFLETGLRLERYVAWMHTTGMALSDAEREFIETGITHQRELDRLEDERKKREEEIAARASQYEVRTRQFRRVAAILGVAVLLTIGGGLYFRSSAAQARDEAAVASTQIGVAQAEQLTAEAGSTRLAADSAFFAAYQDRVGTLAAGAVVLEEGGVLPSQAAFDATMTAVAELNAWEPVEATDSAGVVMVQVPPGCFYMGSVAGENEQPVHEICFDAPYWIDKFEVTNAQYMQVTNAEPPSTFARPMNPVESLSWFEADIYCGLRGGTLPTEAQWEYAARGPDSLSYPWGNTYADAVVIAERALDLGPLPVMDEEGAPYRPENTSWVGAVDMSGNVFEWTSTRDGDLQLTDSGDSVPVNPYLYPYDADDGREDGETAQAFVDRVNAERLFTTRIVRGGYYNSQSYTVRGAYRIGFSVNIANASVGMRCAASELP